MELEKIYDIIEQNRSFILEAEEYIRKNPETGFREWKTHRYLKEKLESVGLCIHEFDCIPAQETVKNAKDGNYRRFEKIPGFYVDFDTGIPGPKIAVFAEMDALTVPNHPDCDKLTGAVHACGHHTQCAALLGIAKALSVPDALEGLCGSVRLIAVPAEELIEVDYRRSLKEKGIIHYFGGKQELLYRGVLNGVDIAFMTHANGGDKLICTRGSDGFITKKFVFYGKATHACAPEGSANALYAANLAINAANALRETFAEKDYVRFHPIITAGGSAVNVIPDKVEAEAYLRCATLEKLTEINRKINRAFAASAAAMGCRLEITDTAGYSPMISNSGIKDVFTEAAVGILGSGRVDMDCPWETGCSDMGDVSNVIPSAHFYIGGASGTGHGCDYFISDPVLACVTSAKIQTAAISLLLKDGAAKAKNIIENAVLPFKSADELLEKLDSLSVCKQAVSYADNGEIVISV